MTRRFGDWTLARIAVALASFVPFVFGLSQGASFYFRDLSSYFFPIRRFVVEGLRRGEIRHWNPYVNEGTPVLLPPLAYPLDALQALVPNEWGFSLLLALHVPLAALTFLALARRLGCRPAAAALGAIVYALCGFSLSSLNLYIHLEALAWAPLVIASLLRATSGGRREIAVAGAALAVCLSTTGVEIAAQAVACAFVLSVSRQAEALLRFAGSVLLGAGLAASPLLGLLTQVAGSQRDAGFRLAESLAHSAHPVSLLQTVVAGLYGDPIAAGYDYWGGRFSGGQFPYFVSLYLGGATLAIAAIGAVDKGRYRTRLLLLLAAGLALSLGRFARLDVLLELVPVLAKFRFPVKAFFTVVVAASVLASFGAERLVESRRSFRPLLLLSGLLGLGLVALLGFEAMLPGTFAWLQDRFFMPSYPQSLRAAALRAVASDAAAGGAALLAVGALAALVLRERISTRAAVVAATAIVAADLVRAGVGLNPTAQASLYALSPEMTRVAARLRESRGRAFTCVVQAMPSFREAARQAPRAGLWSTAVWWETLSPYANVPAAVETTGADATALVAARFSMSSGEVACQDVGTLERLRASGVRFVLSVQPFTNDALRLVDVASPAKTAPLSIYVYELSESLKDPAVSQAPDDVDERGHARGLDGAEARYADLRPGFVRALAQSPSEGFLILRRTNAPGWSATVNGRPAVLATANGRHQAVAVPSGASEVVLRYRAPRAWLGLAISLSAAVFAAVLFGRGRAPTSEARTALPAESGR